MTFDELDSCASRGALFTHILDGRAYVVIRRLMSKCTYTGNWYDAVLYKRLGDGAAFVMDTVEFCDNFNVLHEYGKDEE